MGYRQRKKQACFGNAAILAMGDRGTYVEGFALNGLYLAHHAWITLDGVHAIDPTWRAASTCCYFGIQFPTKVVGDWVERRGGYADALLDWEHPELLHQLLGAERLPWLSNASG
jgi:hypothetical protein